MKHATLAPLLMSLALVSLAGCQEEAPPPPETGQQGGAQGEVLEGTISDDMLPLDVVIQPSMRPVVEVEGDAPSTSAADDQPAPTEDAEPAGDASGQEAEADQSSEG